MKTHGGRKPRHGTAVIGSIEPLAGGRLTRGPGGQLTFSGRVEPEIDAALVERVGRRLKGEVQCMYCAAWRPKCEMQANGDYAMCADMLRCPERPGGSDGR